ncbi:MAG: NAD(P)/FAD-dependent oxidoreductase [Verrucomicrobiota bacterium]
MSAYDTAIIGAGHNGLICACYLAKAGHRVAIVERRPEVGGAVCTKDDLIPGYKIDVGSSVHIMIHLTPILKDLELESRFGLEYIEMDPWAYYPILGTKKGIHFYKDIDQTCESIATLSKEDAQTYKQFVKRWTELNEGVFETFLKPPTPGKIFGTMLKRNILRPHSRRLWSSLDTARQLMAPYGQVIKETFKNDHLRAALLWLSAQSGPTPDEVASGDMLGWNAMIHRSGAKRAKGGSGMLSVALEQCLKHYAGDVITGATVTSLRQSGDAWAINYLHSSNPDQVSQIQAKRVVSACHIQTLFKMLKDEPSCPSKLSKRIDQLRVGNGFGMIVRHAVEELPMYGSDEISPSRACAYHSAMQLLCPSESYLRSSLHTYAQGLPPQDPSVVAMTFSAIDPTLAPPDKHTLFTWAQYHPYELSNQENWDDIKEREADKLYDLVCRYAPNMKNKMIDRYIQTPLDIERLHGLLRANVMHLEMSLDQMFFFRPLPELADYKTPMKNLFLTGSSTHPGGGVFGASGYNTAQTVLSSSR